MKDYLKLAEEFNGSNNDFNHAGLKEGYALGVRQFADFLQSQEAEKGEEPRYHYDGTPCFCRMNLVMKNPSPLQGLKEIEKLPKDMESSLATLITNFCQPVYEKLQEVIENQNKIVSILKQSK